MNMNLVKEVVADQIRHDLPKVSIGDYVRVNVNIVEGEKRRIQAFEGTVIKMRGEGVARTFTVRKISNNVGVERSFPFNSPVVDSIKVLGHSKVRRAKLYYLRNLTGKSAKLKQVIK